MKICIIKSPYFIRQISFITSLWLAYLMNVAHSRNCPYMRSAAGCETISVRQNKGPVQGLNFIHSAFLTQMSN